MKTFLATFAAIADATRTHLKDFDPSSYESFYGYPEVPVYDSGEVYYEHEDPYVKRHEQIPVYDNVPVYDHPVHVHHEHTHQQPVYHEPVTYTSYPDESYESYGNVPTGDFWD